DEDIKRKKLEEARIESKRIHHLIATALEEDGALTSIETMNMINAQLNALENAIKGENIKDIKQEQEKLDKVSQAFLENRLNMRLTQALKGAKAQRTAEGEGNA